MAFALSQFSPSAPASPVTAQWNAATSGTWTTASLWSTSPLYPDNGNGSGNDYTAIIGATGSAYTVTLASTITLDNLSISSTSATLDQTGGILHLLGTAAITSGSYYLDGGTIQGGTMNIGSGGSFSVSSNSNNRLDGATINGVVNIAQNSSRLRLDNGATISGTANLIGQYATLALNYSGTVGTNLTVNMVSNPSYYPAALTIEGTNTITFGSNVFVHGEGTIGGQAYTTGSNTLINQGIIQADLSTLQLSISSSNFNNKGALNAINGGILILNNNWQNNGTITGGSGSTINLNGAFPALGSISLNTATLNVNGTTTFAQLNTITNSASVINLTSDVINTGLTTTLNPTIGQITLNGGRVLGGTVNLPTGTDLLHITSNSTNKFDGVMLNGVVNFEDNSSRARFDNGASITGTANLIGSYSALGLNYSGTIGTNLTINLASNPSYYPASLSIEGANTITLGSGVFVRGEGTIGNQSFITTGSNSLVNQGAIQSDISGLTLAISANSFINQGTLTATNGATLVLNNNWQNNGTITGGSGSAISLNGTYAALGQISISSATLNINSPITISELNTITNVGSVINITNDVLNTGSNATLSTVVGQITLNGGRILGGTLNLPTGTDLLHITSSSSNRFDGVAVNGVVNFLDNSSRARFDNGASITGTANLIGAYSALGLNYSGTIGTNLTVNLVSNPAYYPASLSIEGANTITLGSGVFVHGEGTIGNQSFITTGSNSLINQGTIQADITGYTLAISSNTFNNQGTLKAINGGILTLNNNWQNNGTITGGTGSTINLNGTFPALGPISINNTTLNINGTTTIAEFNTITNVGSTINITSDLINTGLNSTLSTTVGQITLNGGRILGGTVNLPTGTDLLHITSNSTNRFDGVAINGVVNLLDNSARVRLDNGASITGTVNLIGAYSALGLNYSGTVGTNLTVNLTSNPVYYPASLSIEGANAITLGSGVFVHGEGTIGNQSFITTGNNSLINQGTIQADITGYTLAISSNTFNNQGTLNVINGGILTLNNSWQNNGTISGSNGTINLNGNSPALGNILIKSSTLNLNSATTIASLNTIGNSGGSLINIANDVVNTGLTSTLLPTVGSLTLNGGRILGGTLNLAPGAPLFAAGIGNNRLDGVTVNGVVNLTASGAELVLNNGALINGTANLSGAYSYLALNYSGTLGSNLTVSMTPAPSYPTFLTVEGTNNLTFGPNVFVHGNGSVGGQQITTGSNTLINQGTIQADVAGYTLTIDSKRFINQGLLSATNGGVLTINNNWQNNGTIVGGSNTIINLAGSFSSFGTIIGSGGITNITGDFINIGQTTTLDAVSGSYTMNGGRILGGTLNLAPGSPLLTTNNLSNRLDGSTVNGVVNLSAYSSDLVLNNGALINGAVNMTGPYAVMALNYSGTLGSNLTVNLAPQAGYPEYLTLEGTNNLTFGPNVFIHGNGSVGGQQITTGSNVLINQGTIQADVTGQLLTIDSKRFINQGLLSATNGGVLTINNNWQNNGTIVGGSNTIINLAGTFSSFGTIIGNGGITNITGDFINIGQTTTLDAVSGSYTMNGGRILGGTLNLAPGSPLLTANNLSNRLDGSTVNGVVNLSANSSDLVLNNGALINGTVNMTGPYAVMALNYSGTLGSNLTVNLAPQAGYPEYLTLEGTNTLTLGPNVFIHGNGSVGGQQITTGSNTLINQGTIQADIAGQLLTIDSKTFINQGVVSATNGGILTLNNNWQNNGNIIVGGSNSVINLSGTFSSFGTIFNNGSTINIVGNFLNSGNTTTLNTAAGSLTMNGGRIFGGVLNLAPNSPLFVANNGGNRLDGSTVNGVVNLSAYAANLILNNGALINGTANLTGAYSALELNYSGTLGSNLAVSMNPTLGYPTYLTVEGTNNLTFGPNVFVHGDGSVGGQQVTTGSNVITNQGIIQADVTGYTLSIDSKKFVNQGLLGATNGGIVFVTSSAMTNSGTVQVLGTGNLSLKNGTTVLSNYNLGTSTLTGGTWNVIASGSTGTATLALNQGGNILVNNATVLLSGSGSIFNEINAITSNPGSLTIAGGRIFTIAAPNFVNSGQLISANGGFINLGNNWQNTGLITGTNGTISLSGTLNSLGNILLNTGTLNLNSNTTAAALSTVIGHTSTINLSADLVNTGLNSTLLDSTGSVTLKGGRILSGTLNLAPNSPLLVSNDPNNRLDGGLVNGVINLADNGARVLLNNGATISGTANLSGSSAALEFNYGGTVANNIQVNLAPASTLYPEYLTVEGTNTLTLGSGVFVRGVGSVGGQRVTIGNNNLINQGTIQADVNGLVLSIDSANFTNQGLLSATNGGILTLNNNWHNNGTIIATNSTLNLSGTFASFAGIINNNSNIYLAGDFINTGTTFTLPTSIGSVSINGGRILGGTLNLLPSGPLLVTNNTNNRIDGAIVNGVVDLATTGGWLRLNNGATINGTVNFTGYNTVLALNSSGTIGNLTANMDANPYNYHLFSPASITVEGTNSVTFAANTFIRGQGSLGGQKITVGNNTITNLGTIQADVNGQTLSVFGSTFINQGLMTATNGGLLSFNSPAFTNLATVQAMPGSTVTLNNGWKNSGLITSNSATLNLSGTFNSFGLLSATNSTLNINGSTTFALINTISNSNSVINLNGDVVNTGLNTTLLPSTGLLTMNGGRVLGGTLTLPAGKELLHIAGNTPSRFDNVVVNGVVNLTDFGAALRLDNGAIISGTVNLTGYNGVLAFDYGGNIASNLTVNMDANPYVQGTYPKYLTIEGTNSLTFGNNVFIRGSGSVGDQYYTAGGGNSLTNQGVIQSDIAGQTLTIASSTFINQGLLTATNGSFLSVGASTVTNNGTFQVFNGSKISVAKPGFLTNYNLATSTLTGGSWFVTSTGSSSVLSLNQGGNILTNNANVLLSGGGAVFSEINSITTNNGLFAIAGGRQFTTTGPLTNTGTLQVLDGSTLLTVSGSLANTGVAGLAGGTLTTPELDNNAPGVVSGFGTVQSNVVNNGTVLATGGLLTFTNGIQGGAVQVAATGQLDVSAGVPSNITSLTMSGTALGSLNLGSNNITIKTDYTNTVGTGNSYNPHANVTGSGLILALNAPTESITGNVTSGTASTSLISFGNVHVGSVNTANYAIAIAGAANSTLVRGAIQTSVNGGNITDTRLTGAGVTAGNFGPIAAGTNSGNLAVVFNANSGGALAGQSVNIINNFDNVAGSSIQITGTAYRYAAPSTAASVNLGFVHIGDVAAANLSIANTSTNDGFSEILNASVASSTGSVVVSGSLAGIAPGHTNNTAFGVSLPTDTLGVKSGTVTLAFNSDGTGSSGLGITQLPSQNVSVQTQVNAYASAAFTGTGLTEIDSTHYVLNLGTVDQGTGTHSASISLQNVFASTFQDSLGGTFTTDGVTQFTLANFAGPISLTSGGSMNSTVSFDSSNGLGSYSNSLFFNPTSFNASTSTALNQISVTLQVSVIPEPNANLMMLAGLGVLIGAQTLRKRRNA